MTIRRFTFSVRGLLACWLPPKKRNPKRMSFFAALLSPFDELRADFGNWKEAIITQAQVTGETASLQWYLNSLFDPDNTDIAIVTAGPSGKNVGLFSVEPAIFLSVGRSSSSEGGVNIPLKGEDSQFGSYSFAVFVPAARAQFTESIRKVVQTYKLAGKSFKIIYF